jgi:hypothetical protein
MILSIMSLDFFILDHNKNSFVIHEIFNELFTVWKLYYWTMEKMFYSFSPTLNWCVQWSMKIVWIEDKSHIFTFVFLLYTTKSCVSLHFWCLSSIDFFFSSYFLVQFHFPIEEKCRYVLQIHNFFSFNILCKI